MENKQQLIINELENNKSNYYFYIPPSNGVPSGAIAYVYDMVEMLKANGYSAFILHDEKYMMPRWMGGEYHKLPHISFKELKVKASDFLFLPEVYVQPFFKDMDAQKIKLPCEVVVLSQVESLILHSLDMGVHWYHFGIRNVITTSEKQKHYISKVQRGLNIDVINPYIHEEFKPSEKPQTPKTIVFCRDKDKQQKISNEFSRVNPHYSWIPLKYVDKMDREEFATNIRECALAVWVDDISSWGTFPLECMASGVPVVGKIPEMMPEWMGEEVDGKYKIKDNGMWLLSSHLNIVEYMGRFFDEWITDNLDDTVYNSMKETVSKYSKENSNNQMLDVFEGLIARRIERVNRIFEKQNKNKKPVENA